MLYHPIKATSEKYEKFVQKLQNLTEIKSHINHYSIPTSDGVHLDTFYIKNRNSNKCIIYFHGNSGNISMRYDMIKFLYNYTSVIIFDYRSFGRSTHNNSTLSEHTFQKDTMAVWEFATNNLKINPDNISLCGESLGCSLAIYLVSELSKKMNSAHYPHSLILNSPFYSLQSMIEVSFD